MDHRQKEVGGLYGRRLQWEREAWVKMTKIHFIHCMNLSNKREKKRERRGKGRQRGKGRGREPKEVR